MRSDIRSSADVKRSADFTSFSLLCTRSAEADVTGKVTATFNSLAKWQYCTHQSHYVHRTQPKQSSVRGIGVPLLPHCKKNFSSDMHKSQEWPGRKWVGSNPPKPTRGLATGIKCHHSFHKYSVLRREFIITLMLRENRHLYRRLFD